MYSEDDLLPLSALQHLLFCPRQCGLIHVEGLWAENRLTVEGQHLHRKAHDAGHKTRPGVRAARGLPLRSWRLGLAGKADIVEFRRGEAAAEGEPAATAGAADAAAGAGEGGEAPPVPTPAADVVAGADPGEAGGSPWDDLARSLAAEPAPESASVASGGGPTPEPLPKMPAATGDAPRTGGSSPDPASPAAAAAPVEPIAPVAAGAAPPAVPDPRGPWLPGVASTWRAVPVEYKRGKPKANRCDEVQLCAQALCLEEMLGVSIPRGFLFYGQTRRRVAVAFDAGLRRLTEDAAARLHAMVASGVTPRAVREPKCRRCSLLNLCLPDALSRGRSASRYLERALREEPAASRD